MKNIIKSTINIIIKNHLTLIFLLSAHYAVGQGIQFEKGSISEAYKKAKKQKKYVFVDVFTTWCGPCKVMSQEVFPLKEVGDYFNQNLVSLKVDAEKGEGIDFAKKHKVDGYPTLFIIDPADGSVIKKRVGGLTGNILIRFAKTAIDKSSVNELNVLEKKFNKNPSDFIAFKNYYNKVKESKNDEKLIRLYTLFDKNYAPNIAPSLIVLEFIRSNNIKVKDNFFTHLSMHYNEYSKLTDTRGLNEVLIGIYQSSTFVSFINPNPPHLTIDFNEISELISKDINLSNTDKLFLNTVIDVSKAMTDFINLFNAENPDRGKLSAIENNLTEKLFHLVDNYKHKINAHTLFDYMDEMEAALALNASDMTLSKKITEKIKIWREIAFNKANRDPSVLGRYAFSLYMESLYDYYGDAYSQNINKKLAHTKLDKSKKLISSALKKARLANPVDIYVLDKLLEYNDFINQEFNIK